MPPDSDPVVVASVIIPAHNAQDTIARQLEALTRQVQHPPFEVVVVANICSDDTIEVSRAYAGRLNIHVLEANETPSAAYARNVGARHASGEFFLFCDADDEVQPEWVGAMVEPLAAGRGDFVGGAIELDRSKLPKWLYHWRYADRVRNGIFVTRKALPVLMTASLGVSKSAFSIVNGFDESFLGAAGEDVLFVRSLFRAGQRLGPAPRAKVLYAPRTSFTTALAHSRASHRGRRANADIEGKPPTRPSLARNLKQALRRMAAIAVRRRYVHPLLAIALLAEGISRWRVDRSWTRSVSPHHTSDFFGDYCVPLETALVGGRALRAPGISAGTHRQTPKGAEMGTHRVLESLLPRSGCMIDVGANIGSLTIAGALQSGPGGRVVAFEPGLEARTCLMANVDRHGVADRVTINVHAVGSESSQKVFYTYVNSLLSGFAEAVDRYRPGELIRQDLVEVVALDDAVSGSVDLLKIDVEGFEHDVLIGAQRLIAQNPQIAVIFEVNFPILRSLKRSTQDLLDHFPSRSWCLFRIDEENTTTPLTPLDDKQFEEESLSSNKYFNVLAVRLDNTGRFDSLIRS